MGRNSRAAGAQNIYSAANRQSALHAGPVPPDYLLPLVYETYNNRLRRVFGVPPRKSSDVIRGPLAASWVPPRLPSSRRVSLANPFAAALP